MDDGYFDAAERAREKQRSRDRDDADLAAGRITMPELKERNAFIPGDMARSSVIRSFPSFE